MFKVSSGIARTAEELDAKAKLLPPCYYANLARAGDNPPNNVALTAEQRNRLIELYAETQETQLTDDDLAGVDTATASDLICRMERKLAYRQTHGEQQLSPNS